MCHAFEVNMCASIQIYIDAVKTNRWANVFQVLTESAIDVLESPLIHELYGPEIGMDCVWFILSLGTHVCIYIYM